MGDHSRKSRERRQMVPNKILSFSHLALIVILVIIINAFTTYASPLEPYKRGRSASSSLIPFPRVGRSVSEPLQSIDSDQNDEMLSQRSSRSASKSQFYGQKRTAPSTRVKRSLSTLPLRQFPVPNRLIRLVPGKRGNQYKREPTVMIPVARIGKRPDGLSAAQFTAQPEHQSLKRDPWFWDFHFYDTALPEHQMFKRPEIPESQMFQMPRYGRSNENTMIPVARIGKRSDDQSEDNYYKSIPMPRIG